MGVRKLIPIRLQVLIWLRWFTLLPAFTFAIFSNKAVALDPPHDIPSNGIECLTCHIPHGAPGGSLTQVEGNPNLCMSCHNPGGMAAALPFNDVDQAIPGLIGTSHRWDSGPSGHVTAVATNASLGDIRSGGTFTGRVEKTYTITISVGGDVGLATFDWIDNEGNSATGVATADQVTFVDGLILNFKEGSTSPSFLAGDSWTLRARTDLRLPDINDPFERELAARLADAPLIDRGPPRVQDTTFAKVVCSVCHDQHSQEKTPFDPSAPPFTGDGTGAGRHFQRQDNDTNQMCVVCHEARNVVSSSLGSHPVSVTLPVGDFQTPPNLPLDPSNNVVCMSCHAPHFTDSGGTNSGQGDGYLLRQTMGDTCFECHTLADQTGGSHFDAVSGALWPGGQYGSSFPAHTADKRGQCVNCHWPHGWPDDDDIANDYPRLWVEQYDVADDGSDPGDAEDLCNTCHDGSPAQTDIRGDFVKGVNGSDIFHHPIVDSEQALDTVTGQFRSVECVDCHNPHKARSDNRYAGITGTNLDNSVAAEFTEAEQYKLCFNCHGDTYNQSRAMTSNKRIDFAITNSAYHPVVQAGRNQSQNLQDQLSDSGSGLTTGSTIRCTDCHNSDVTGGTPGPVTDSPALTQGPHGSNNAPILRANLNRNFTESTAPASYNRNNYEFCFLCHDETMLTARDRGDGARTNFDDQINGKDNLHWVHLVDKADKARATCSNCHFDIHSNISADNTQYRIDDVLYPDNAAVSAAGRKTHMVNFSPDITPYTEDGVNRTKPEWWLNTSTGERRCYLACHGETMAGESGDGGRRAQYRPAAGDEIVWTY